MRFGLSGGAAGTCHYTLMWMLICQHFTPGFATTAGYAVGTFVSYALHKVFSFKGQERQPGSFARYCAIVAAGAVLNLLIVQGGCGWGGMPVIPVQAVAAAVVLLSNYVLTKRLVFQAAGQALARRPGLVVTTAAEAAGK